MYMCIFTQNKLSKLGYEKSLISGQPGNLIQMYFIGISSAIRKVRNLAFFATQDKDMSLIIPGKNGIGKEHKVVR